MSPLASVLQTLPQLSPQDLQTVSGRVKALLPLSGISNSSSSIALPDDSITKDYILEGVHHELRKRGLIGQKQRIPERSFPNGYVNSSYAVRSNVEAYLPRLRSPEKTALGNLMASTLAEWMEMCRISISTRAMLVNVSNIPRSLEFSFPGYLKAGLLPACWRGPESAFG